jgi:hypothetical protein
MIKPTSKAPNIAVSIVSSDDRDDLYAELCCGDMQYGEVALVEDKSKFVLKIFMSPDRPVLEFDAVEFAASIDEAITRLRKLEGQ